MTIEVAEMGSQLSESVGLPLPFGHGKLNWPAILDMMDGRTLAGMVNVEPDLRVRARAGPVSCGRNACARPVFD